MLTITQTAAEALDTIVASTPEAPDTAGLRIAQGLGSDGQAGLTLSLTETPEPTDAVVEGEGVPVFVAAEVAPALEDKILDAQVEGDQVGFMLAEQAR